MKGRTVISAISIVIIAAIFAVVYYATSGMMANTALVSSFGFLALISIIFVLAIPLLARTKKPFAIKLLANRRWIGIWTFIFALIHPLLVFHFFYRWDVSRTFGNVYTPLGFVALLILAAMAATSTDTAVRKLGKNWKRLHLLIYVVLALVIVHSFSIGRIFLESLEGKIVIGALAVMVVGAKVFLKLKKPEQAITGERVPISAESQAGQQPQ